MSRTGKWSLVGLADDLGVFHQGGRLGAALGPAAFRRLFHRFQGRADLRSILTDFGDVAPGPDLEDTHARAEETIRKAHEASSGCSVMVGGGHDFAFPHLRAIQKATGLKRLGCLNIDAHFDLRKPAGKMGSGSPFYLAIEAKVLNPKYFVEFGIQSQANTPVLWDYARSHKVRTVEFSDVRTKDRKKIFESELKKLARACDGIVLSVDLDALSQAFAPGVSAPQAEGFTSDDLMAFCEVAGNEKKVISLGLYELNPLHDIGDMTARIAAVATYRFLEAKLFG